MQRGPLVVLLAALAGRTQELGPTIEIRLFAQHNRTYLEDRVPLNFGVAAELAPARDV